MKRKWFFLVLIPLLLMMLTVPVFASSGAPGPAFSVETLGICVLVGVVLSGIICAILASQMKNVHTKTQARDYVAGSGLTLTGRNDVFLRRTVTRRKIDSGKNS